MTAIERDRRDKRRARERELDLDILDALCAVDAVQTATSNHWTAVLRTERRARGMRDIEIILSCVCAPLLHMRFERIHPASRKPKFGSRRGGALRRWLSVHGLESTVPDGAPWPRWLADGVAVPAVIRDEWRPASLVIRVFS